VVDPRALVEPTRDSGVPGGALLIAFADALIGTDRAALDAARAALAAELGPEAVSAAAAVAANFGKNDRIANALGIPLEEVIVKAAAALRAELGLDAYPSAVNTLRHMPGL
jgi:hypothetical protein